MFPFNFLAKILVAVLLFSTLVSFQAALAVPVLQIQIIPDSQTYNVGSKVNIFTNITLDGSPAANIASAEMDSSNGTPVLIRTVKTGNVSLMYFRVQILDLYTSTATGAPQTLFQPGSIAYANITIRNIDVVQRHTIVGLFGQDSSSKPIFAFYASVDDIGANLTVQHLVSFPISTSAAVGQARIYGSLFTDYPSNRGYAYCPEKTANFSVTTTAPLLPQQPEYSNITFSLPRKDCYLGNYTINAATNYEVLQTATDTSHFKVVLLGDMNKDYLINMRDITAVILLFNTTPQSPNWNPDADLNKDGIVNMRDVTILVLTFLNSGIP
jgi:hypothetical protein